MKKRLRKKKHLKEFKELGFSVSFDITKDHNEEKFLNEWCDLLDEYKLANFCWTIYPNPSDEFKNKFKKLLEDNFCTNIIFSKDWDMWYGESIFV